MNVILCVPSKLLDGSKYDKISIDYNLTQRADKFLTEQLLNHPNQIGKTSKAAQERYGKIEMTELNSKKEG